MLSKGGLYLRDGIVLRLMTSVSRFVEGKRWWWLNKEAWNDAEGVKMMNEWWERKWNWRGRLIAKSIIGVIRIQKTFDHPPTNHHQNDRP